MKKTVLSLIALALFSFSLNLLAQDVQAVKSHSYSNDVKTVKSPQHRAAMLELYTSEGCSSCPPAEVFLSELKNMGISDKQLIPLAFHVTYWDYIGWKDRFAKKQFDDRQRDQANKSKQTTVYTPQFVLSGRDFRQFSSFSNDVNSLVLQKSSVDLVLTATIDIDTLQLNLKTDISKSTVKEVGFYFAVIENDLSSLVDDGENEGKVLHHDYVVRQLSGPYFQSKSENQLEKAHTIVLKPEWKRQDLSIIAFAENRQTGEILQAVRLSY
jgi:hypothetical protein